MENEIKTPAIMVDVDGTLALMHHKRSPFDWDKVGMDLPNKSVITLVNNLYKLREIAYCASEEIAILIMSGRDGSCNKETKNWLDEHKVKYDDFFMRPEGNFEKDSVVKHRIYIEEIYPHYDVQFVLDDRNQVVDMWRSIGLPCFQVAPGNF